MQEKNIAPEVKAALARCFAAHQALRSYSADIVVAVRGIPNLKDSRCRIALARPGRLRLEGMGPRERDSANLIVAQAGYVYQSFPRTESYTVKRVPFEGDAMRVGLEESELLLLPLFSQLMASSEGLSQCLEMFRSVSQQAGRLVFMGEGRFQQTMVFDEPTGLLKEVRMTQGAAIEIRETYQNVRANPNLPASLWRFVPPAGYTDQHSAAPSPEPSKQPNPARPLGNKKVL